MSLLTLSGDNLTTQAGANLAVLSGPMNPNLPLLRVRIGLPENDATKDAEITGAWKTAIALAEQYTDRYLTNATRREVFTHFAGETMQLRAYPVDTITKISGSVVAYHLNKARGTIYFDGREVGHEITIDYSGGYSVFPSDLMLAILVLFDSVWLLMENPGAGAASSGAVKSVKAGDISIQYDTGGGATIASGGGGMGGAVPPIAQGILEIYRRWSA